MLPHVSQLRISSRDRGIEEKERINMVFGVLTGKLWKAHKRQKVREAEEQKMLSLGHK